MNCLSTSSDFRRYTKFVVMFSFTAQVKEAYAADQHNATDFICKFPRKSYVLRNGERIFDIFFKTLSAEQCIKMTIRR